MFQGMRDAMRGMKQLAGAGVLHCDGVSPVDRPRIRAFLLPLLRSSVSLFAFAALPALSGVLNDTGITYCGDDSSNTAQCNSVSSDGGTHPRQDATNGRDANGGGKGFDFTKLDNSGNALNANATNWACVRDNVTGLVWENKSTAGLHNQSHTYSWFKTDPINGSILGVASGGSCETAGRCDTEKFVADVNATQLCGADDWRMPTVRELEGLSNFSRINPAIDTDYFPNTQDDFWTSTRDKSIAYMAWFVDFFNGSIARLGFEVGNRVRLVRGAAAPSQLVLTDNGATVTDNGTRLMWKRNYEWRGATAAAWGTTTDRFTWPDALKRAVSDTTGGHSDWRLPNIKELRSLIDHTRVSPALDTTFFGPTVIQQYFWSSSPFVDYFGATDMSWVVGGDNGQNEGNQRTYAQFVRLVRDAPLAELPGAPTNVSATSIDGGARLTFTAPASSVIDGYRASCVDGASTLTGTAATSPITVNGMTSGTTYSCTVLAYNGTGNGPPSSPPVSVAACSYALGSNSLSVGSGLSGNNVVNVTSGCAWAATSNVSWISVTSGASSTGNASVAFSVEANKTGAIRIGTLTIAGKTFSVTQASNCSFSLSASSQAFTAAAGDGSFSVNTTSDCRWSVSIADGSDSWISVATQPSSLTFDPIVTSTANYHVSENLRKSPRQGTLIIAGQNYVVSQDAAATELTCTVSADPPSAGTSKLTATCTVTPDSYIWSDGTSVIATCTAATCDVTPLRTTTYSVAAKKGGSTAPAATVTVISGTDQIIGSIGFSPATLAAGGTTTVSATASSGLAVSFRSTTTGVCSVSGSTITGIAAGTCTVEANQAGTTTTNAATPVTQNITVTASSARLINLSTRGQVQTGDNVMIGGFIISGATPKKVLIRAVGPNLANYGVQGALTDPTLQLFSGATSIAINDDWVNADNKAEIEATNLAPAHAKESAILTTLNPGAYTAIVNGNGAGTGVGMVEVYELDHPEVPLFNISTRGQVLTGDNVMIGGFIIQGDSNKTVLIRAIGPTLTGYGITGALGNPTLQLFRGSTALADNDDWGSATNKSAIEATGLAPLNAQESAILISLPPGAYTAVVSGANGTTGVGMMEVFAQ